MPGSKLAFVLGSDADTRFYDAFSTPVIAICPFAD
jgi:hypothetical protein